MKLSRSFVFVCLTLLMTLSIEACTHKTLITEEDGFKYYKVIRDHRIGVKDLDGNIIVPVKMKEIIYSSRYNKQHDKERWFWCCCYDNDYKEIYNADNAQCIIGENLKFKMVSNTYSDEFQDVEPTSTYFLVGHEGGGKYGYYNYWGKEIIPLKYESIIVLPNTGMHGFPEKYDKADLIRCRNGNCYSVFDVDGRCIVPADFQYTNIRKVAIPTPTPLLECTNGKKEYDYRYSKSGELFMSGLTSTISVQVIDEKKDLYYLSFKDANHDKCYYDVYGNLIMKTDGNNMYYDDERGFYYWDRDNDKDRYINKKIDDNGHVVPVRAYSNSSWGWGDYGNQDIWMESGLDGGYEWNDYSNSSNSYSNGSTTQPNTRKCGLCGGSGEWAHDDESIPDYGTGNKYCSKCGKIVGPKHVHTPCPSCKGKGYW